METTHAIERPLRLSEFAKLIGVSRWTVRRLIQEGQVKTIKIRGVTLIPGLEARRIAENGVLTQHHDAASRGDERP